MDTSTNPKVRTGRCWGCQLPARKGFAARAAIYQWAYKKGRRLADAYCPVCGDSLAQTTAANLKHYFVGQRTPIFTDSHEDALKELRERKGHRNGAYSAVMHAPHALGNEDEDEGILTATEVAANAPTSEGLRKAQEAFIEPIVEKALELLERKGK